MRVVVRTAALNAIASARVVRLDIHEQVSRPSYRSESELSRTRETDPERAAAAAH